MVKIKDRGDVMMKKIKIAFRIVSGGSSSILPIIQHMCTHDGFKLENIKEYWMHLYNKGSYEDMEDTDVQAFSESEEDLDLLQEVVTMFSVYFRQYEPNDDEDDEIYSEMIEVLFNLLKTSEKAVKKIDLDEYYSYFLLEAEKEDLLKTKDVIKKWEKEGRHIS